MGTSSSSQRGKDDIEKFDGIETLGYRVLGVQPNSPASKAGLVSFLDFLVGADQKMLLGSGENLEEGDEYDDVDLPAMLRDHLNMPLELLVYNIKSQESRLVTLIPSSSWGGAGLLGVTIRLDDYGGADERLIRVLTVEHNSPAAIAGLLPEKDYLLGTTTESFEDTSSLSDTLHRNIDKVCEIYVYNTDSDVVRVVALMPTWSWGGGGLLGAEVGTGYLHRLPLSARKTSGTSIERKVRWVGVKPTSPTSTHAESGTLEVEPQLEMETTEEGTASHATPQEVADHGESTREAKCTGSGGSRQVAPLQESEHSPENRISGYKNPASAADVFSNPPPKQDNIKSSSYTTSDAAKQAFTSPYYSAPAPPL